MPSSRRVAPDDWDQHWDDLGESAAGNPANTYRQRLIFQNLEPCPPGARILDIGSGQGELAVLLRSRFPSSDIWGLEYSSAGVRRASLATACDGRPVRFTQRDLLSSADLAPSDQHWATHAVCSEVLEHVDRPDLLLRHAREYLAPGCRVVVTVPAGPRSAFDRHIGHRQHFTPRSLRETLEAGGFVTTRIDRAGAPFFNLYRLIVMLRGRRLIEDLSRSDGSSGSLRDAKKLKAAYRVFDAAFRLNLPSTPFGWQLVAVASPGPT
jgi:SAM-dependent methyltransferase